MNLGLASLEDPAVRAALERHLAAAFDAESVTLRDPALGSLSFV